jgi:hypothetical protein
MSIRTGVLRVKRAILNEIDTANNVARENLKQKALKAVSKGQGSGPWEVYMKQFVDDEGTLNDPNSLSSRQLKRLMGTDGTGDDDVMNEKRAYLVADGGCTSETIFHFGRNASDQLDLGLDA